MVEIAWAAVALGYATLAVLATALFRLGSRIDATNARMDSGFAAMNARMDSGFAAMNARLDAMNARMDSGFAAMNARLDAMNARMGNLEGQLAEHIRRHAG